MTTRERPILVTGATGKIGGAVVRQLRERGHVVRALAHRKDARSEALSGLGAEVRLVDLFDPIAVAAAMRGVRSALYVPPVNPFMIQSAVGFFVAAESAGLEGVVVVSQWLAGAAHPSLQARQHWLVDRLFARASSAWITVTPAIFADSYLDPNIVRGVANLGMLPNAFGPGRDAPPSVDDIAAVCTEALIAPEAHAGRNYRPTGPTLLSMRDMGEVLAGVLGRKVKTNDLPLPILNKALRASGWSDFDIAITMSYGAEAQGGGARELGAPTTHVRDVTGREPEAFETVARRVVALPDVRPSFGNKMRALADFAKLLFTPALDVERYRRTLMFPSPSGLHFDHESEAWRRERERIARTGRSFEETRRTPPKQDDDTSQLSERLARAELRT